MFTELVPKVVASLELIVLFDVDAASVVRVGDGHLVTITYPGLVSPTRVGTEVVIEEMRTEWAGL
jgi:hypothetical protein